MPLISVIVPVYKVESYLHRCVDSILNQTFKDFELILVDDGSPDNCPQICCEYAKQDRRVKVIHKENGGLSSARNAGLDYIFSNSNSEYISFVDSDDWIDINYINELYNLAINYSADVVICGVCTTYEERHDNTFKDIDNNILFKGRDFIIEQYKNRIYSTAWAKLYKKDSLKNVRFVNNVIHEDEYFINDYYPQITNCLYNPSQLYYYFQGNKNSIMNNLSSKDNWFAVDSLIKRYKMVKTNRFETNYITTNMLLNTILVCYGSFAKSIPPIIDMVGTVFRIIIIFPSSIRFFKIKCKLLLGLICYLIGLKTNRFIVNI